MTHCFWLVSLFVFPGCSLRDVDESRSSYCHPSAHMYVTSHGVRVRAPRHSPAPFSSTATLMLGLWWDKYEQGIYSLWHLEIKAVWKDVRNAQPGFTLCFPEVWLENDLITLPHRTWPRPCQEHSHIHTLFITAVCCALDHSSSAVH